MKSKLLFSDNEWSFPTLEKCLAVINKIAREKYKLDFYEAQVEIITSSQMLDAHCSHAMPVMYNHWSFGKHFASERSRYDQGHENLAYEVVINTNPSIAYCLENNTMTMQALVLAHAACGHNHFFKNNYLFKEFTNANSILPYLRFAKDYVAECEKKYGEKEVTFILDAAHSLMYNSVDKYKRRHKKLDVEAERLKSEINNVYNELDTLDVKKKKPSKLTAADAAKYNLPEYNLLYFIEKHSVVLEPWQKEICRIVRQVSQYFYPQILTKVMNEGFASFIHYNIMNDLYDMGYINESSLLEALNNHCGVLHQPDKSRLNPYVLGYKIFEDVKRMCTKPTDEDREYFPHLVDSDPMCTILDIVESQKDTSFIGNFLSPKVIRDLKLFVLDDKGAKATAYSVESVPSDVDYINIRRVLSESYEYSNMFPEISVSAFKVAPRPKISLLYDGRSNNELDKVEYSKVIRYFAALVGVDEANCLTTFLDRED
jgi:stage V sporulation protein R